MAIYLELADKYTITASDLVIISESYTAPIASVEGAPRWKERTRRDQSSLSLLDSTLF